MPLSRECTITETGLRCRADGTTVLAGASYRMVQLRGVPNICQSPVWSELRCVQGCDRPGVPRKLEVEPYEC